MKIEIKDLYGVKNEVEMEFENGGILFAPNGTGKTSITKGFMFSENGDAPVNLEGGAFSPESLVIDGNPISQEMSIRVYDAKRIDNIINDPLGVIKGFLRDDANSAGDVDINIYVGYIDTYGDVKAELDELGIKYEAINIDSHNLDGVDDINKIFKKTTMMSDDEIGEFVAKYREYTEFSAILDKSKVKDFKELEKRVETLSNETYDSDVVVDFNLMSLIKNDGREEIFGYKIKDKYKSVKEVYSEFMAKAAKNGVPKESIEALKVAQNVNVIRDGNTTKGTQAQVKFLSSELEKIGKEIHNQIVKKNEANFKEEEKEFLKKEEEFIKNYNAYVDDLNKNILKINKLKWNIKVNRISKYHEKTSIKIMDDGDERVHEDLIEYASEGQKRIISILLATAQIRKTKLVVFDDIVSSLDSDNLDIFREIMEGLKGEVKFLLLTHSYTMLSKMGNIRDVDFFAMDGFRNNVHLFKFNGYNALVLYALFETKSYNLNDKTLLASTALREVIDNYMSNGYAKELTPEEEKMMKNRLKIFKSWMEETYRHYKTNNRTFKEAAQQIRNKFPDIIELFDTSLMRSLVNNESEDIISNYVLSYDIDIQFNNLLDYISKKYVYALKIRFEFEKKVYQELDDAYRNKWDNNKILGFVGSDYEQLVNKDKLEIFIKMFSHNHLNNLRWTPIIETPLYKVKMYSDGLNDGVSIIKK